MEILIGLVLAVVVLCVFLSWALGRVGGFLVLVLPIILTAMLIARGMTGNQWTPGSVLLGFSAGAAIAIFPGFVRVMIEEWQVSQARQSLLFRRAAKQIAALVAEENRSRNSWGYRTGLRCAEWCERIATKHRLNDLSRS